MNRIKAVNLASSELNICIPEFTVAGVPHGLFFVHKWWVACDDKIDTEMLRKKIDEHLIKLNDDYAVERKKCPERSLFRNIARVEIHGVHET